MNTSQTDLPQHVRVVEVGPRDGLQNEPQWVSTATKLTLIERLINCGIRDIEATAFVSPKRAPQMADAAEVVHALPAAPGVHFPVLVPNLRGFETALAAGAREVAVFAAASESFSQRHVSCSIAESVERFRPVLQAAHANDIRVRGYVSCVVSCPYQGDVAPQAVTRVACELADLGCYEISLGDTLGAGTPASVARMLEAVLRELPASRIAGHFHDTYGMAIANIQCALEFGLRNFDASVAGLGGCPYAPGASGNVATEDVVYLLNGLGYECGINLDKLVATAWFIAGELGREPASKVARALKARSFSNR
ncbi:MAG TPA: hydroxymethylglutaryl-CoA lyase [Rhodocyclaceae bacterium]|nr:hydroxymethylglutaryl-CoA lyase [Rhodocyclaceae bacterium]